MTAAATAVRGVMPLSGHAREARNRAVRAAVAVGLGIIAGYALSDQILEILRAPIAQIAESRNASLNFDTVTGAFDVKVKIAIFAGIALSSPVWIYELFAFIAPGLSRRERKYTIGYAATALMLFISGCVFGFVLFPRMVELLTSFASDQDSTILNATYYLDFVLKILLATGIAFVLPVLLVLLNALEMVSSQSIRRSWRLAVVAIVVFSALVTPAADVLSLFLIAVPMALLFGAAVAVTHAHDHRRQRRIDSAAAVRPPIDRKR